jgi:hypothetical protein
VPLQTALGVASSEQVEYMRARAGGLVRTPTAGARVYPSGPHTVAEATYFRTNHTAPIHSMYSCAKQKANVHRSLCGEIVGASQWPRRADVRGLVEKGAMAPSLRHLREYRAFRPPSNYSARDLQMARKKSYIRARRNDDTDVESI